MNTTFINTFCVYIFYPTPEIGIAKKQSYIKSIRSVEFYDLAFIGVCERWPDFWDYCTLEDSVWRMGRCNTVGDIINNTCILIKQQRIRIDTNKYLMVGKLIKWWAWFDWSCTHCITKTFALYQRKSDIYEEFLCPRK